jgi:hypothetical protein
MGKRTSPTKRVLSSFALVFSALGVTAALWFFGKFLWLLLLMVAFANP